MTTFQEMIEGVADLHRRHRFHETGGENMIFRMALLSEELGEICRCLTKGEGNLADEHADLLILLLGNCLALNLDIETAFWAKLRRIMDATPVTINGHTRVSTSTIGGTAGQETDTEGF